NLKMSTLDYHVAANETSYFQNEPSAGISDFGENDKNNTLKTSRSQQPQIEDVQAYMSANSRAGEMQNDIPELSTENTNISEPLDDDFSNIVAIFVTRFDTKKGNIIEWQYPKGKTHLDLGGIEFQSIPSGLHLVSEDIIYFYRPPFIGLSVFMNEPTMDQSQDRGAHMAAVGILVSPTVGTGLCGSPWRHIELLQDEVRNHVHLSNDYSSLKQYFDKYSIPSGDNVIPSGGGPPKLQRTSSSNWSQFLRTRCLSVSSTSSYQVSVPSAHPAQHFPKFVRLCGPTIFMLWRAALLKKRILFYSPPPIMDACYSVYDTCLLANIPTSITRMLTNKVEKIKPLFNVGVSEIPLVESIEGGYVACTTDRILQHKNNLYDLLVNLPHNETGNVQPILIASPGSSLTTNINATDIRRYRVLLKILASHGLNNYNVEEDGGNMTDTGRKMMFGGWFWWYGRDGYQRLDDREAADEILLNNQPESVQDGLNLLNIDGTKDTSEIEALTTNLFNELRTIIESSIAYDSEEIILLYPDHLIQLGLDPHEDGVFVEEFAEMYFGKKVEVIGKGGGCLVQLFKKFSAYLDDSCCCFRLSEGF
ncbi:9134_t:CDS:10, partial [Acaulospora morrowiae]